MKRGMKTSRTGGFTLVELLTVIVVIGVLLSLLIPALNQVTKTAIKVKQKAQFHAIGTALEAFRNDYGDYPSSMPVTAVLPAAFSSHILAEALVGQDGLGFHPSSLWRSDGLADMDGDGVIDNDVYHATVDEPYETAADNLAVRKGPYLDLESANAIKAGSIYSAAAMASYGIANNYILADMYKVTKNAATGKDTGMPILYYKANKMKIGNDPLQANWAANTYSVTDNYYGVGGGGFVEAPTPFSGAIHPLKTEMDAGTAYLFYEKIENPNFTNPARPYRAESFLLHSAGPDGLYGTVDDVFNFDQDN